MLRSPLLVEYVVPRDKAPPTTPAAPPTTEAPAMLLDPRWYSRRAASTTSPTLRSRSVSCVSESVSPVSSERDAASLRDKSMTAKLTCSQGARAVDERTGPSPCPTGSHVIE